jgi:hypothetical protein
MATQETIALVSLAPSFVVSANEIKARIEELQAFVRSYMVPGEDYGTIPGTQKPTLYKPGAEKLCDVYGFTKEFVMVESLEDWDGGRFAYTVKAILRSKRTGLSSPEPSWGPASAHSSTAQNARKRSWRRCSKACQVRLGAKRPFGRRTSRSRIEPRSWWPSFPN